MNPVKVVVVIGAGSIGLAIARRISAGKHILLADVHPENNRAAANVLLNAGFQVSTATVDVSSRDGGVTAAYWYGDLASKSDN